MLEIGLIFVENGEIFIPSFELQPLVRNGSLQCSRANAMRTSLSTPKG